MRKEAFVGVYEIAGPKFHAALTVCGKSRSLGIYDDIGEAARAVDNAKFWLQDFLKGGVRHLNFPQQAPRLMLPVVAKIRRTLLDVGYPQYEHLCSEFVAPEKYTLPKEDFEGKSIEEMEAIRDKHLAEAAVLTERLERLMRENNLTFNHR